MFTPSQPWSSASEILFLRVGIGEVGRDTVAGSLTSGGGEETAGDRQLVVYSDGSHGGIFLHVADGVTGVVAEDLTMLALVRDQNALEAFHFDFVS